MNEHLPVAVVGAGPVGLAAAARLVERGIAPVVFERGTAAGAAVAGWGHVRVFSPWSYNIDAAARALLESVFEAVDRPWRGFGVIPGGGLGLRAPFRRLGAEARFSDLPSGPADSAEPAGVCISGAILQGRARPMDCPAFGTACTPEHPLGAPMVSSEGACAAYHRYGRRG